MIEFYNFRKSIPDVITDNQRDRLNELIAEEKFGVYTEIVIQNFKTFITNVGVAILFSVVLVISPTILKDRSRGTPSVAVHCRKREGIFSRRNSWQDTSPHSLLLLDYLTVYFSLYSLNNTFMFFKVRVNTFIRNESWYDPTFFQFIMLCIAAIYLIGFIFVTLSMSFSNVVPNMVSLIGIQIPFVVGFLIFGLNRLLPHMILIWNPKWLAPVSYSWHGYCKHHHYLFPIEA